MLVTFGGKMNIIITGSVGSGYKSIAFSAAKAHNRKFVDTDEVLTRNLGITLQEVYSLITPDSLSELLVKLCRQLAESDSYVIAAGDMILTDRKAMRELCSGAFSVYIKRSPEEAYASGLENDHPLLARGRKRIFELYIEREKLYSEYADAIIDYTDDCAETLLALYERFESKASEMSAALSGIDGELYDILCKRGRILYRDEKSAAEYASVCIKTIQGVKL